MLVGPGSRPAPRSQKMVTFDLERSKPQFQKDGATIYNSRNLAAKLVLPASSLLIPWEAILTSANKLGLRFQIPESATANKAAFGPWIRGC